MTSEPDRVARCRLTIQNSEATDPKAKTVVPRVCGWDGARYLNELAPQHMIDWSEYE